MIHLLLHRHWPLWYRAYYGRTTYFIYQCAICKPNHPNAIMGERKKKNRFYIEDYVNRDELNFIL